MESLLIALIVAALIMTLIFSRLSPALLFTVAMAACVLAGAIDMQVAMGKATNEGLVTLLLLLMVSVGLERLPWLLAISNRAVKGSLPRTLLSLSGMTMLFSAFVNNTAVVATLAGTLRKNPHHAASQILLPISYAAILGGTLTLIGTSTNLIVSSFLEDVTGEGISFFAFLPVALPAALAAIPVQTAAAAIPPAAAAPATDRGVGPGGLPEGVRDANVAIPAAATAPAAVARQAGCAQACAAAGRAATVTSRRAAGARHSRRSPRGPAGGGRP